MSRLCTLFTDNFYAVNEALVCEYFKGMLAETFYGKKLTFTSQKKKLFIKFFISECDQICSFLQIGHIYCKNLYLKTSLLKQWFPIITHRFFLSQIEDQKRLKLSVVLAVTGMLATLWNYFRSVLKLILKVILQ